MPVISVDFGGRGKFNRLNIKAAIGEARRTEYNNGATAYAENVDPSRIHLNRRWINPKWNGDWDMAIRAMHQVRPGDRKFRDDRVLVRGFVMQVSPEWAFPEIRDWPYEKIIESTYAERGPMDREKVLRWYGRMLAWAQKKFGDALLEAHIHLDENGPHMHVLVIPIVDGRLDSKKLLHGKKACADFLDEIASVCSDLGLNRAVEGGDKTMPINQFRRKQAKALEAAEAATKIVPLTALPPPMKPKPLPDEPEYGLLESKKSKEEKRKAWEDECRRIRHENRERRLAYLNELQENLARMHYEVQREKGYATQARKAQRRAEAKVAVLEREKASLASLLRKEERFRAISLEDVLKVIYGAAMNERYSTSATGIWCFNDRRIAVTGPLFKDALDTDCEGMGALDLVMKLDGLTQNQLPMAIARLKDYFSEADVLNTCLGHPVIRGGVKVHVLDKIINVPEPPKIPMPVETNAIAIRKWLKQRAISETTLEHLLNSGQIYADERRNITIPRVRGGCFLRGTAGGQANNFKKTLGGKSCGPAILRGPDITDEADIILVEGIPNAIALADMRPDAWVCVIGGNLRPTLPAIEPTKQKIFLAFDRDRTGEAHYRHYRQIFPDAIDMRPDEGFHDWSEQWMSESNRKKSGTAPENQDNCGHSPA